MKRPFHGLLAPALLTLAACAPATRVVLLPQEGVPTAAVEVQSQSTHVVLAKPYQVAEVRERGEVEQKQTDASDVQKRYGQLLSVQPAADCCTDMMPLTTMATTTTSEKIVT